MSSSDPSDGNQSKPRKGMNEKKLENIDTFRKFIIFIYRKQLLNRC